MKRRHAIQQDSHWSFIGRGERRVRKRGRDRCLGTRAVNKREERGREYRREGGREGRIERESRWVRPF